MVIKNADSLSSLFLLFFSIFIGAESCRLGLGEWKNPGAGYFSFAGALILGLMSLKVFLNALCKPSEQKTSGPILNGLRRRNVGFVLGGMMIYGLVLETLGYILSTFLLVVFFLWIIAPQRWRVTLLTAFLCAVCSYLLFHVLLGADLPRGFIGF